MTTLAENHSDIPFALFYLIDRTTMEGHLEQASGIEANQEKISPLVLSLKEDGESQNQLWEIKKVVKFLKTQVISVRHITNLPLGLSTQSIRERILLPVKPSGQEKVCDVLIMGVNPTRKLDNTKSADIRRRKKAAEKLAEIDRAKTEFFSNVSHEFRTPLTLILSPLEDALSDEKAPLSPEQRNHIVLIQRNGFRLLKLVKSLLVFSCIEANQIQAIYEPTDIAELTIDLVSISRSLIEKERLELIIEVQKIDEKVYVDREMYEKIIFNLLSNAFKFTLKGKICISLKSQKQHIEIRVKDTGVGIPEKELSRVFERFHRIEGTQGRSYEGTGIGLALVKELVKLHSGTIQVESQSGQGTEFIVKLP